MVDNPSEAMLRRLRNLKMFKDKTDDDIREYLANRSPEVAPPGEPSESSTYDRHDRRFKYKLNSLQKEHGIDMNDANDADALRQLVRMVLQAEEVDKKIREMQTASGKMDSRELKNLGDYQRSVQMSITDLQNRLGIERRQRKEKQVDDIPKYIEALQEKAKKFWSRKTLAVRCEKDQIELLRFWVNFPKLRNSATFELECWKCHETVVYKL